MKLPPLNIRQRVYKLCKISIPAVGLLYATGLIPLPIAGPLVTLLGTIVSVLADKGSEQLQKDGTTILTGSVSEQVNKGMDILLNNAVQAIDILSNVGQTAIQAKEQATTAVLQTPILGDLARQAMKLP